MSKTISQIVKENTHISNIESYKEAGNMIRHYSQNRVTIISMNLPICFALLGLSMNYGVGQKQIALAYYFYAAELFLFCLTFYSSLLFSTLVSVLRQRLIAMEKEDIPLNLHEFTANFFLKKKFIFDDYDKIVLIFGSIANLLYALFLWRYVV